jgi:hypothetical protein
LKLPLRLGSPAHFVLAIIFLTISPSMMADRPRQRSIPETAGFSGLGKFKVNIWAALSSPESHSSFF